MVASVPMFIRREPSPSRDTIFSSVERAMPRAMEEQRPMEP